MMNCRNTTTTNNNNNNKAFLRLLVLVVVVVTTTTTTTCLCDAYAFSTTMSTSTTCYSSCSSSSGVSAFRGRTLMIFPGTTTATGHTKRGQMDMKKGKPNVPPGMRGNIKRQQEMSQYRESMMNASKPGKDGLPVFNLFVRSQRGAKIWYPAGTFKGDERSAALAKNYADQNLLAGISKNQLDNGVSGSLAQDLPKFIESVVRGYPQLRDARNDLEFGYKLGFEGLSEELSDKVNVVVPEKQPTGFFETVKKNLFGN